MMEEYIHKNEKLWDEFLAELNPDLLKPSEPHISIRHHIYLLAPQMLSCL